MQVVSAICFVLVAVPSHATGELAPRRYVLDGAKSELVVKTFKEGLAAGLAHNHVISATDVSGQLQYDPLNLASASVTVTIQTASMLIDAAAMRKKHGEPQPVPEADRRKVTENLKAEGQLGVAAYPTITFTSTSLTRVGDGMTLSGAFTLHGVTKTISMPISLSVTEQTAMGDANFKLKVSDYGITPYSTALGTIRVKDEVELMLHLVAKREGTGSVSAE